MEFSVCVLSSGSTGNSVLVTSRETRLLVDAGLSGKRIRSLLESVGVDIESIDAIMLTHEHNDHITGVGPLSRKYSIPVYATAETFLAGKSRLKELYRKLDIYAGRSIRIKDIDLLPFPTFHDAAGAVAFVISHEKRKLGVVTDIGHFSRLAFHRLQGCSTVVLEANYCPSLLKDGPYPWALKQRIRGRKGHLSNQDTCRIIRELSRHGLKRVILSHLSQTNNHPDVVMRTLVDQLPPNLMESLEFFLAHPDRPSEVVNI